jgi:hypothetical protein
MFISKCKFSKLSFTVFHDSTHDQNAVYDTSIADAHGYTFMPDNLEF